MSKDQNNQDADEDKKQNQRSDSTKSAKKLAQAFLGLTVLTFAVYFALNFMAENEKTGRLKGKTKKLNSLEQLNDSSSLQSRTEIQQKIIEKLSAQPELVEFSSSIEKIIYKSQIKNEKILNKIKEEIQNTFLFVSDGAYLLEIDLFSDDESSDSDEGSKEYSGTDSNIVLQISFIEKKSSNKVGELGVSIPVKTLVVADK